MPFLIDGYNLLHAIGLLAGPVGPHGLEQARARLIGMLAASHSPGEATVVFDARQPPPGAQGFAVINGVHVHFAFGEEADDCIERLIAADAVPKKLVVVSDDRRLQRAARRRGCPTWTCDNYFEWVERSRRPRPTAADEPDKPTSVTPEEAARWQAQFGGLQTDPEFKDLFDDFGTGI